MTTALSFRPLDSGWTLRAAAGPAPDGFDAPMDAVVPGCVHTDLLAAGLIPDPFLDDNESALAWIGLVDWTYATIVHLEHRMTPTARTSCSRASTR